MLPVGLSALVVKSSLIGIKGVQAHESTGSARIRNSRITRSTAGWESQVCLDNQTSATLATLVGRWIIGPARFELACAQGARYPAPRRPPTRPVDAAPAWSRRNPRSARGIAGTS